jgi:hypothetical protein
MSVAGAPVVTNPEVYMKIAIVTTGMLMLASSMAAHAQILKCVSKDGKIEFATACPAGTKQQDTGVGNKPAAAPPAAKGETAGKEGAAGKEAASKGGTPSLADRDAEFRKRQADQKEAAAKAEQKTAESQDQQRACEAAKGNLVGLQSRQRMIRVDPKTGERINFEEADYLREIGTAERQIAQNCKS